ncbi:redoxin domain-containing protein [Carboxylicivirga sediminis]|uniref:Redoxin domain-containing protein n=1 Tax=Carboxylicivirga sediminis TaxID=2006564 RepID=A0A941IZU8_9BACT|nr:thioredoxin-like domain-containing protein [Carboxylicivirga sediminis]MBR8537599.1 redoxin domain-containing protein [Carboxylicivirga sediminis]
MKNIISLTLYLIYYSLTVAQTHSITVSIDNYSDSTLILGYYFNKKMLVKDTAYISPKGNYLFKGDEKLEEGLYIVYLEDRTYFDLLIGKEQQFKVNTAKSNLLNHMTIEGSAESADFLNYQQYLVTKQKEAAPVQEQLKANPDAATKAKLQKQINALSADVKAKYEEITSQHPNSFLSIFLKATQEIEVPQMTAPNGSSNPDSVVQRMRYDYYKAHYFDNMQMDDPRILRTPFFTNKLENYFDNVLLQLPDTIIKESHRVIAMANSNYDMEKYLIQHLFNRANESKIMGMDAVLVSLGEAYYLNGRADWVDEEFLKNLQERVDKIKPNILGHTAADFKMQSNTDEFYRLSEIRADITILVFWEPECGHCEKEIPKLYEEVWKKYANQDIKIVAVYTQWDKEPWVNFINEHQLHEWIHLYDPYNRSNFRNNYDIYSTPVIYILDKDKKILAKRIGSEQIPGFLDHHFKLK